MNAVAIIPARYASTRFPGKPLAPIRGIPMIEHVYRNVSKSKAIREVWVATDDPRIEEAVLNFGGKCIMTSKEHQTGSDRLAEAAQKLDADLVINVQGDEPLIRGEVLDSLVDLFLQDDTLQMATLKSKIQDEEEIHNPNVVKVITNLFDEAIYFSRSPIPYNRDGRQVDYFKHIGVYAYTKKFLLEYVTLPQTELELAESLEQLRALENGAKIKVLETDMKLIGVDTPQDIQKVEEYLLSVGERK
jgi:3-deoxy-manno-octulosonate cytidylyltransferase (CMP-KDO synthetase)